MKELKVETHDGRGIAYRLSSKSEWFVDLPSGEFRWVGNLESLKQEIERRESGSVVFRG